MTPFETIPDLRIGRITEVSGTSLRVELGGDIRELTRSYNGQVYSIGQMGTIVKIHFGRRIIFAIVKMLRMKSEMLAEAGLPTTESDSRILEADLFGEGTWNKAKDYLDFERGIKTFPLPQQDVFLSTREELEQLYKGAEKSRDKDDATRLIRVGSYANSSGTPCNANADKLFGQHCAVLGSTGSGKSGTVSALLHSVLDTQDEDTPRPLIIVIDPHGEYTKCFGERARVYKAYNPLGDKGEGDVSLCLPYWLMSGDEFRSLVIGKGEHEATSQNNIIYRSLAHARMVGRDMVDGAQDWLDKPCGDKDPLQPAPKEGFTIEDLKSFDRDLPLPFNLSEFENHISKNEAVKKGSGNSPTWKPKSATEYTPNQSILNKLSVLRSDPRTRFMMEEWSPGAPDLADILEQFVGRVPGDKKDIRIIDISGLPNEVAGPLTALIARLLFQYKVWQSREEREQDPVLFVCEEAHRYVPSHGEAEYAEAQKAIQRIAKEGRKYGLGLMLISQRPSDVDGTVMSQCNSWIILRLTNSSDQDQVRRYLPDNLSGMTNVLPSLARQEALFVGEAASIPARIRVRNLTREQLPDSQDISFIDGWRKPIENNDHIKTVTDRWQRVNLSESANSSEPDSTPPDASEGADLV